MAWESAGLRIRRENQRGEETFRLNGKSFVSLKEGIRYSGDDSAFNIVSSNSTIYYRMVNIGVAHPVLLSAGGTLIGYCFSLDYQRQIYYSSQVIATRTCYGGVWSSWERIK